MILSTRSGCLLSLLLAAGTAACRRGAPAAAPAPRQTLEDFTLRQSRQGNPLWALKSQSAVLREDERVVILAGPSMEFLKAGRVVSRVRALTGRALTDTHDVRLSGSVVLEAIDDRSVLSTEYLDYSSKAGLFTTDAEITVRRPEGVLHGRGLKATPDLSEISIYNQSAKVLGGAR